MGSNTLANTQHRQFLTSRSLGGGGRRLEVFHLLDNHRPFRDTPFLIEPKVEAGMVSCWQAPIHPFFHPQQENPPPHTGTYVFLHLGALAVILGTLQGSGPGHVHAGQPAGQRVQVVGRLHTRFQMGGREWMRQTGLNAFK